MQTEILECLKKGFELGVQWTNKNGVLKDPYESNRPENFAPACWAVLGATLYRLTEETRYLEWTERWMKRTAEILEGAKNSPGFREYVMGYGVMVFPILTGIVAKEKLDGWRAAFAATYQADAGLSDCHVSATSLLCDLFADRGREDKAGKRAEQIIATLKNRLTTTGFLRDDDLNGHAVSHAYLTCSFLATALVKSKSSGKLESLWSDLVSWTTDDVVNQVEDLLTSMATWAKRANGDFHLPFLANRSIYQMYAYPMVALLAYIGEGKKSQDRVRALLNFCQSFNPEAGQFFHTPNHFSPYALAGLEWTYNRLNTDLGAGLVAWSLLALLIEQDWPGYEKVTSTSVSNVVDPEAGYVILHGEKSRLAFALREHNWGYHLPLQPLALKLNNNPMIEPIADAKRDGVKHPFRSLLAEPQKADPLLEPYFGIAVKTADGNHHIMKGDATAVSETEFILSGDFDLSFRPELKNESILLTYQVTSLTEGDNPFFSIPMLLWDGKHELQYTITDSVLELTWKNAAYRIFATGNSGPWDLHMGRYMHAGCGLTANISIPLSHTDWELQTTVTIEKVSL